MNLPALEFCIQAIHEILITKCPVSLKSLFLEIFIITHQNWLTVVVIEREMENQVELC